MSDTIHDYTHDPEFGLEWGKWLQTVRGKMMASHRGRDYDDLKNDGLIWCLCRMLARRDERIKELLNQIADTQQNFP